MNLLTHNFGRILILAAHPDDETIACSGLLQRCKSALVVFAVDAAPPHYRFEKKFGSLRQYSELRFQEASQALAATPHVSLQRLCRLDGTFFVDQHLFLGLPEAFASLKQIACEFSPDMLVSHAFEGGHIDHDASHVLARQLTFELGLDGLEFPLYWRTGDGQDAFQRFRQHTDQEYVLQLSQPELLVKRRMLAEYRTQQRLTHVFQLDPERFRPMLHGALPKPNWFGYPFENRRRFLNTDAFLDKVAEFEQNIESSIARQNA